MLKQACSARLPHQLRVQFGFGKFCLGNGLNGLRGIGGRGGTGGLETTGVGKSPEGKANSSQNAVKHGLRSQRHTILADETREDYEETRLGWLKKYTPDDYHEARLVDQLILNDWLLQRANRRILRGGSGAGGRGRDLQSGELDGRTRTQDRIGDAVQDHARTGFLPVFECSRGIEEGSFARKNVKRAAARSKRQRDRRSKKELGERPAKPAEAPVAKAEKRFRGQKSPKKQKKIVDFGAMGGDRSIAGREDGDDAVSVERDFDTGRGEEVAGAGAGVPADALCARRAARVFGRPATSDSQVGRDGDSAHDGGYVAGADEKEKALGAGHLLPCGGNLPRPEERGGCDCPTCSKNRAILEARAAA